MLHPPRDPRFVNLMAHSRDGGPTWGYPAHLLRLSDDRLLTIYGVCCLTLDPDGRWELIVRQSLIGLECLCLRPVAAAYSIQTI
jgi:hypothetical protein